jgi:PadR family transcriptional regulator, regulatory protein PadR
VIIKRIRANIARGSTELIILSLLAEQPLYGFEISRRIEKRTKGALRFELASLYPMLYDLERRGSVKGQWQPSSTGRDRRYYSLTRRGNAQLVPLRREWRSFFQALDCVAGVSDA